MKKNIPPGHSIVHRETFPRYFATGGDYKNLKNKSVTIIKKTLIMVNGYVSRSKEIGSIQKKAVYNTSSFLFFCVWGLREVDVQ